jgi:hypothetical protein
VKRLFSLIFSTLSAYKIEANNLCHLICCFYAAAGCRSAFFHFTAPKRNVSWFDWLAHRVESAEREDVE